MSVTRNQRVIVAEPLALGGQITRPAMNITRAALLGTSGESGIAVRTALPISCPTHVKGEPVAVDQPLDFSVRSSSNSPTPQQQQQQTQSKNDSLPLSKQPLVKIADRAVESLLMLSQTGVHSSSSSSASSSNTFQSSKSDQRPRLISDRSRNRRKPAADEIQRRNVPSAPEGMLVMSDGDSASPAWQTASSASGRRASSVVNNAVSHNLSVSSASMDGSGSFSPSSNGTNAVDSKFAAGEGARETNRNRRYFRQQSSIHPQQSSSIPPDSTTVSVDGDGDADGDGDGDDDDVDGERIKVRTANGVVNRRRPRAMPDERKDESYWERRRKNNEAAKRSRDARRQKEDDVAYHCRQLEQENKRLRDEIAELRAVIEQLRAEVLAREQRENRQQSQRMESENSENCDPVVEPHSLSNSSVPVVVNSAAAIGSSPDNSGDSQSNETGSS